MAPWLTFATSISDERSGSFGNLVPVGSLPESRLGLAKTSWLTLRKIPLASGSTSFCTDVSNIEVERERGGPQTAAIPRQEQSWVNPMRTSSDNPELNRRVRSRHRLAAFSMRAVQPSLREVI